MVTESQLVVWEEIAHAAAYGPSRGVPPIDWPRAMLRLIHAYRMVLPATPESAELEKQAQLLREIHRLTREIAHRGLPDMDKLREQASLMTKIIDFGEIDSGINEVLSERVALQDYITRFENNDSLVLTDIDEMRERSTLQDEITRFENNDSLELSDIDDLRERSTLQDEITRFENNDSLELSDIDEMRERSTLQDEINKRSPAN